MDSEVADTDGVQIEIKIFYRGWNTFLLVHSLQNSNPLTVSICDIRIVTAFKESVEDVTKISNYKNGDVY